MADIRINHLAIAVEDIQASLNFWHDALGIAIGGVQDVPDEEVKVAFMELGNAHIELVQPTTDDSGIRKYMDKKGTGIHHICFDVDDVEVALAELSAKGIELINETPKVRDGKRYAFVHPRSTGGVLVELYDSKAESAD